MGEHEEMTADLRARLASSPFHGWAGMSVLVARPGEVEIALDAEPHHLNLQGVLHGGMIATLADTAAGIAVRTQLDPGRSHVTVSLSVQYLRPGTPGRLIGRGRVLRMGLSLAHATADVVDAEGRLLATASATIALGGEARSS
jgi:uncharacterized protein (TIGR00369 family)